MAWVIKTDPDFQKNIFPDINFFDRLQNKLQFDVIFINPHLVISNFALAEWIATLSDLYLAMCFQKIQIFWLDSSIDTFYNQNMLSWSTRDAKILCYLTDANTLILKHCFLTFSDVITRMSQVFEGFTTFTNCFVWLQCLYSW